MEVFTIIRVGTIAPDDRSLAAEARLTMQMAQFGAGDAPAWK